METRTSEIGSKIFLELFETPSVRNSLVQRIPGGTNWNTGQASIGGLRVSACGSYPLLSPQKLDQFS
jgi:hypothetical protein